MKHWLKYPKLESTSAKLIPLTIEQSDDLIAAARDGELWNLYYTSVPSPEDTENYILKAISEYESGSAMPFAVISKTSNTIVGSTRFMNISEDHKRLEIGSTWYASSYQKTSISTECKYLLLRYAFESLNCMAVEFRTHSYNHASRKAIERLGAKQDGILRNHRIDKSGNKRDTVVFSILDNEWKSVKNALEFKLKQY